MQFILNECGLAGMIRALQNLWSRAGGGWVCVCVCVAMGGDIMTHTKVSFKIIPRIFHNAR